MRIALYGIPVVLEQFVIGESSIVEKELIACLDDPKTHHSNVLLGGLEDFQLFIRILFKFGFLFIKGQLNQFLLRVKCNENNFLTIPSRIIIKVIHGRDYQMLIRMAKRPRIFKFRSLRPFQSELLLILNARVSQNQTFNGLITIYDSGLLPVMSHVSCVLNLKLLVLTLFYKAIREGNKAHCLTLNPFPQRLAKALFPFAFAILQNQNVKDNTVMVVQFRRLFNEVRDRLSSDHRFRWAAHYESLRWNRIYGMNSFIFVNDSRMDLRIGQSK